MYCIQISAITTSTAENENATVFPNRIMHYATRVVFPSKSSLSSLRCIIRASPRPSDPAKKRDSEPKSLGLQAEGDMYTEGPRILIQQGVLGRGCWSEQSRSRSQKSVMEKKGRCAETSREEIGSFKGNGDK